MDANRGRDWSARDAGGGGPPGVGGGARTHPSHYKYPALSSLGQSFFELQITNMKVVNPKTML